MSEARRSTRDARARRAGTPARATRARAPVVPARAAAALVPAIVALLLYLPALGFGFVHDDHALIEKNPLMQAGAPVAKLLISDFWPNTTMGSGQWRPLILLSYRADLAAGHGSALPFHAGNLLAHAATSALVGALAFETAGVLPAVVAGTWFAAMPAHAESVAWISGRTDLWCALFVLLALWADRRARRAGRAWPGALSFAAYALALAAKETAVAYLVALAAAEWCDRRPPRGAARWLAAPFALTLAWALAHVALVHPTPALSYADATLRARAQLAAWTLFPHEVGFLLPWYPHSPQVAVGLPHAAGDAAVVGGAFALALALALLAWALAARARVAAWLALFVAAVLPVAIAMWSQAYLAFGERVIYLASAGAALALALALGALARRGGAARTGALVAGAVLVLWSAVATARLVPAWRDDGTFADAVVATQADNPTGHLARAARLADAGRRDEALAEIATAERLNPRLPEVFLTRAGVHLRGAQWNDALADVDRALAIEPGNHQAHLLRALALVRLRRTADAMAELEPLARTQPGDLDVESLLGQCLFVSGRPDAALQHLARVAAARADDAASQFAFGQCESQLGHPAEARRAFERCVAIDPTDGASWHRLADMCRALGDAAGAAAATARANQLLPPGAGGGPPPAGR